MVAADGEWFGKGRGVLWTLIALAPGLILGVPITKLPAGSTTISGQAALQSRKTSPGVGWLAAWALAAPRPSTARQHKWRKRGVNRGDEVRRASSDM